MKSCPFLDCVIVRFNVTSSAKRRAITHVLSKGRGNQRRMYAHTVLSPKQTLAQSVVKLLLKMEE